MGAIIALRGARHLARVTLFVIIVGGLLTWLLAPSHETVAGRTVPLVTVGARGVVFGYATYLFTRGFFERQLARRVRRSRRRGRLGRRAALEHRPAQQRGLLAGARLRRDRGLLAAYALSDRRRRGGGTAAGVTST